MFKLKNPTKFWFGTLGKINFNNSNSGSIFFYFKGAGVCLSYGTMIKIRKYAS